MAAPPHGGFTVDDVARYEELRRLKQAYNLKPPSLRTPQEQQGLAELEQLEKRRLDYLSAQHLNADQQYTWSHLAPLDGQLDAARQQILDLLKADIENGESQTPKLPQSPQDPTLDEQQRLRRIAALTQAHLQSKGGLNRQGHDELARLTGAPAGLQYLETRGQGAGQQHLFRDADGNDYAVNQNGEIVGAYDGRSYNPAWFGNGVLTKSVWREIGQRAARGQPLHADPARAAARNTHMLAHLGVPGFGKYGGYFGDRHVIEDAEGNVYSLLPGRQIVGADGKVYHPDDFDNGRLIKDVVTAEPTADDLRQKSAMDARRLIDAIYQSPVRVFGGSQGQGGQSTQGEYAAARAVAPNRDAWITQESQRTGIPALTLREMSDLEHKHLVLGQATDEDLVRLAQLHSDADKIGRAYNRARSLLGSQMTPEQHALVQGGVARLNRRYGNLTSGQRAMLALVVLMSSLGGRNLGGYALPALAGFFLGNARQAQGEPWVSPHAVPLSHSGDLAQQLAAFAP